MGLRQRKSLTRCQSTEGEQPKRKSSSRSPRKSRSAPRRSTANIKLVSVDDQIEQFLNPDFDFEVPVAVTAEQPAATPSKVEVAVKTLGKLESEVIAALFPPTGEPPATLDEISRDLGMTVAEVQNIADEALRGLRGLRTGSQRISKAWN
jgi:hypothetical protein